MLKNRKKKAFTIVELVIVIAVIAILAAVLIPTFSNIVDKANTSADVNVVRNLNMILASEKAGEGKNTTMTEALKDAEENGYLIEKLTPTNAKNEILWDSVNDCFALFEKDSDVPNYCGVTPEKTDVKKYQYFKLYNTKRPLTVAADGTVTSDYSIYLGAGATSATDLKVSTGIDVGEYTTIKSVTYENNTSAQSVILRTKGNMCALTINAPQDHVDHYGYAKTVNVVDVAPNASYHEYGTAHELIATKGKVVIEEVGVVFNLKKSEGATANISNNGGNVMKADAGTLDTNAQSTDIFNINSYEQLCAFRDASNSEVTFKGITVNLNCDITLKEAWTPISNYYRKDKLDNAADYDIEHEKVAFQGTFNGQGHTISGLTDVGISVSSLNTGSNSTTPAGKLEIVYGFFATTLNAKIYNLKFAKVNIQSNFGSDMVGDSVAACIGFAKGDTTLNQIEVLSGSINGYDSVGGIVGMARGIKETRTNENGEIIKENGKIKYFPTSTFVATNCTNNATISATRRCAGIVAQLGDGMLTSKTIDGTTINSEISNCKNTGNISNDCTQDKKAGGFAYYCLAGITVLNNTAMDVVNNNCSNSGTITTAGYKQTDGTVVADSTNEADIAINHNGAKKQAA